MNGAEQLLRWMKRRRFSQTEAAEYFGFDRHYLNKIIKGHKRPGLDNAVLIEQRTGIPVKSWSAESE